MERSFIKLDQKSRQAWQTMTKFAVIITLILSVFNGFATGAAQQTSIKGQVTDDLNTPLPGVTVMVKGTTNGTITDFDGKYELKDVKNGDVLAFSFIGMVTQEIAFTGQGEINVNLLTDTQNLDEVVVTALGIKREEKTLTYAQQTVKAEDLVKSRDLNFVNSLSGKAAGLQIKKSSSGAGGSTKIVLRGSKSLSGDSQPLFVIDGIPMANNKGGQPGMWGGSDQGDGLSQINPDDIESISILKGSNAAVLYGSQGANGVVLITTKKGKAGQTKVSLSSGVTFDQVTQKPDLQYRYGADANAKESWSYTKGDYNDSFVDDFFQTGVNFINTVTVSGGNDKTTAYFSYGNTTANGITPENKYGKHNVTFKQSTKMFNDKVTISSNVMLAQEKTDNRTQAGYYLNPLTGLYFFPRNLNFNDYKNNYQVFDSERNLMTQNWVTNTDHFQSNPYWIVNNQPKEDKTKRVIASLSLAWDITEKLNFAVRGNYDYADRIFEQRHLAGSNKTNTHANGRWEYKNINDQLIYTDGIFKYDNTFGDFSLNAVAGASYQKATYGDGIKVDSGNAEGLKYPNEFYFQNLEDNVMVQSVLASRVEKQAAFANATIGYKNMLYLDLSGRNDWASTLEGTGNHSYFYPAVGLTALVNEMTELPEWITFSKVRASYTTVANEVPYNKVSPQHTINQGGGVDRNTTKPFADLKPEMLRSMEIGTDWRFFDGRLGFDFTYYNINSQDQFIELPAPSGSGYTRYFVNAGEIVNKGIEVSLTGTPIKNKDFSWNTTFNFSKNNNEVVKLHEDLKNPITLGSSEGYDSRIVAGGSIGDLYVYKFKRNDAGQVMFDDAGKPLRTKDKEYIGNLEPDWSLGWNNNFTYKNFDLSFLINAKIGGKVFSQTEAMLDGYGVSERTAAARDNGGVAVNGVKPDGTAFTLADPKTYYNAVGGRNGIGEAYVYDRTNVRLGQVALSYNFDMQKMNLPIDNLTLSAVGQNLFFFYIDAPFDPEVTMSTGRDAQGLDNFNLPATRTFGFNVKLNF